MKRFCLLGLATFYFIVILKVIKDVKGPVVPGLVNSSPFVELKNLTEALKGNQK